MATDDAVGARDAEFRDARLVAVHDVECPWSRDDDWFVARVLETGARDVLDLGCGTGRLAVGLAQRGCTVTGIDPAAASLSAARRRPGAAAVRWIAGTSTQAPTAAFDAALMTSHVAQMLADDADLAATLADLHRALRPGGRLAFDARDPEDAAWTRWTPERTRRRHALPDGTGVEAVTEVLTVDGECVTFEHRYAFSDGDVRRSVSTLRFRSEGALRAALDAAGFDVERIDGGWAGEPVGTCDGELLVAARRR
jgi:SAM-dependent methyltransferase